VDSVAVDAVRADGSVAFARRAGRSPPRRHHRRSW
jgi:hypothetical protein